VREVTAASMVPMPLTTKALIFGTVPTARAAPVESLRYE